MFDRKAHFVPGIIVNKFADPGLVTYQMLTADHVSCLPATYCMLVHVSYTNAYQDRRLPPD